ncbi:MAG TPA: hypothetical protein VHD15_16410 [Hyphomicrobiales bacterium]|nr:hypothetical protein [Hyphomicrobiales bacterium]
MKRRHGPWVAKPGRRQLLTAALACLFLAAAILSGVIGGAEAGAEAWSIDGVVPPLCASLGGHAAPGTPATGHGDHGICALCSATGCVAALAVPPAAAPLPQTAATVAFADHPWRELWRRRPVNWDARPRAPPGAA